jgi:hypothetical protein
MEEPHEYSQELEDNRKSSEDFIRDNIDKANILLDKILEQVGNARGVSGIMVQAVAKLIDSITQAANSLISAEENSWSLQLKSDLMELKRKEFDLKISSMVPGRTPQQNIFVGSFGELLKQIGHQSEKE